MKTRKRTAPAIVQNFCFACGPDNSQGMRLKFAMDPKEGVVRGAFRLAGRYQGSGQGAQGGILATVLDDAMGKLSRLDGIVAPTAELHMDYLRPVPIGRKILVEARRAQRQ